MSGIIVNDSCKNEETIEQVLIKTDDQHLSQTCENQEVDTKEEEENKNAIDNIPKNRKYQCDMCSQRFKQKYILNHHREEAHGKKPEDCVTCGKTFASKQTLNRHNKRYHSHSITDAFPYVCEQCNARFNVLKKFTDHRKLHENANAFKCNVCEKIFGNSFALTRHSTRHTSERQVCRTCKRTYKTREDLQKHVGIHTGEFWCDVCFKVFASRGSLTMHKKSHLSEHVYNCAVCGQCFRCNIVRLAHEKQCVKVGDGGMEG